MKTGVLYLVILSVFVASSAQILLRIGMTSSSIQETLTQSIDKLNIFFVMFTNFYVVSGLFLYGVGAVLWLFVLARVPVTVAYPFVGLGFIVTLFLGWLLLGEQVSGLRLLGTLLVVCGVVLVGKSV